MKLRDAGQRFFSTFEILPGGPRFRARLGGVPSQPSITSFSVPTRTLRVKPGSVLSAGDEIEDEFGSVWAVSFHGHGAGDRYTVFQIFRMLSTGEWTSRQTTKDPVTGLQKNDGTTSNGTIRYTLEPAGTEQDQTNIPATEFDLVTVAQLEPNDRVDGMKVVRSAEHAGVVVARVTVE
jgi:hypothetical protein